MKKRDLNILIKNLQLKHEPVCQICGYYHDKNDPTDENGVDTIYIKKNVEKILKDFIKNKEIPSTVTAEFIIELNEYYTDNSKTVGLCWDCQICNDDNIKEAIELYWSEVIWSSGKLSFGVV